MTPTTAPRAHAVLPLPVCSPVALLGLAAAASAWPPSPSSDDAVDTALGGVAGAARRPRRCSSSLVAGPRRPVAPTGPLSRPTAARLDGLEPLRAARRDTDGRLTDGRAG